MKRGIIAITASVFLLAYLHADSYWTAERIFDIFEPYKSQIAFDSLGNMHGLFSEWEKEDDSLMETLTVYGNRSFYVKYDNEGKLKTNSKIYRSSFMIPISITPYIGNKVIISWEDLSFQHMVVLSDSGKAVSKKFATASSNTRIAFNKDDHIFVLGEHYHPVELSMFSIHLESIIDGEKSFLRGLRSVDDGKMNHYFGTSLPDYALTFYDNDKLLIALRIKTIFKGSREEAYPTKDKFIILRLNENGEDIEKFEIIRPKLDANSIIYGAKLPYCDFFKSDDGSIFLYAESRDHENVVYQIKFSKDGKLILSEERIVMVANRFESIDNLKQVRIQYVSKLVDRNTGQYIIHLYGFGAGGEMYYSSRARERKLK